MTDISADTAIANLTSAVSASLANRFSRIANVVDDFGAAGNGTTNDTSAIQTALNSCAGHAMLLFPAGYTFNVSGITVPSNSHLIIEGIIFLINDSNGPVINLLGSDYVIEGAGIINGNKANNQYGGIGAAGIITNAGQYGTTPPSLPFSNIIIRNITIENCANWPISINSATGVLIEGTTLQNSGNAPQAAFGSQYVRFVNNYVSNIPDYGWAFYEGCSYGICANNEFSNCATCGVLNDGAGTGWEALPSHDIIISNNIIVSATQYGIAVLNVTSPNVAAANPYNIQINDNIIKSPGPSNTSDNSSGVLLVNAQSSSISGGTIFGGGTPNQTYSAISLLACTDIKINGVLIPNAGSTGQCPTSYGVNVQSSSNVTCNDNFIYGTYGAGGTGINISSASNRITISDNIIFNNGQGSTSGTGIIINGNYTIISNNYVYDNQTTKTTLNAISGSPGLGCVFLNNRFGAVLGTAFNVTLNTDTIVDQYNSTEGSSINTRTINGALSVGGNMSVSTNGIISGFYGQQITTLPTFGSGKFGLYGGWDYNGKGEVDLLCFPQSVATSAGSAGFAFFQMTFGGSLNSATPIFKGDGAGNITPSGAYIDGSLETIQETSGGTVTIPNNVRNYAISGFTNPLTSLTINPPTSPIANQEITIVFATAVTSLTWGAGILGGSNSAVQYSGQSFIYIGSNWYRRG